MGQAGANHSLACGVLSGRGSEHLAEDHVRPWERWVPYKIAWVAGCVLFRADALRDVGGFGFWADLPPNLRGEDVVTQLQVAETAGGAGLLPSGAWHLELPTSIEDRSVDAYAAVLEG